MILTTLYLYYNKFNMFDYLIYIVLLLLIHLYLMYTTKFINTMYNKHIYIDSSKNDSYPLTNNTYEIIIKMDANNTFTYI